MAALAVHSRFAGLKIEDDDHPVSKENQKLKKNKINSVKKPEPTKKPKTSASTKITAVPKKKKVKPTPKTSEQWEEWKQKDEMLVVGNYETELQQAILLSKLDYEEKKDVYTQIKKETDIEKKLALINSRPGLKKQKKKNVMSLDQFNEMLNTNDESKSNQNHEKPSTEDPKSQENDPEFFNRIKDDLKNELLKEKINNRVKYEQASDETISRGQFAEVLENKEKEIVSLREEVATLKQELMTVKSRNKKLCNILGQGEMKEKAEILVEVERLRTTQSELTAEIAELHTELEKERSKHTDPKARDKKNATKKKNIRFDVSTEAISKESSANSH